MTQEINLLDLDIAKKEFDYPKMRALAQKNFDDKQHLFITGKIEVFGMNSLKILETLNVIFPIDLPTLKHKRLDKYLEKCDIRLKSVSIPELEINSLSDINRIAENLYLLALRTNCNINKSVLTALLKVPKYYKHYSSKIARKIDPSKLIRSLRNPVLTQNNTCLNLLIKKHKIGDNITYINTCVYQQNNVLISRDELNKLDATLPKDNWFKLQETLNMFLYNSLKDILLDMRDEINYCLNKPNQNYLINLLNLNQAKYKLFENAQAHRIKLDYDFDKLDDEFTINPAIDPVIPRNKSGVIGALCLINKTLVGEGQLLLTKVRSL